MKGRKPLPTKVKEQRGTIEKSRVRLDEMQVDPLTDLPMAPDYLTEYGKKEWAVITRELQKAGVLATADLSVVAMYCNEYGTYVEMQEQMRKAGTRVMVIKDETGKLKYAQQLPQQKISNECLQAALKLAAELGLTPSSRTRIGTGKPKESPVSILDIMAGGKKKVI